MRFAALLLVLLTDTPNLDEGRYVEPLSAKIAMTKPGGAAWDTFGGPLPDPYVRVRCASASAETPVSKDTLTPTWSGYGCVSTGRELIGHGVEFDVFDKDIGKADDHICGATHVVTEADLSAGSFTVTDVGSCNSITFKLARPK